MLRRFLFIFLICITAFSLEAQMKIAPIWCFGEYAGLDFRSNPPGIFKSSVNTGEGSSGATDQYGNLWFYTDGMKVFDRNHNQMPNGIGLTGSPSSSQSAIVLQHLSQKTKGQFYILTVPEYGGSKGFCYSIVDMNLNGGLGDISLKNKGLGGRMAEQMQAAMHANGRDYWVIIKGFRNDSLHVYLIDSSGIKRTSSVRLTNRVDNTIGTMRFNKDYSRFAFTCYDYTGYVQICDFDNQDGTISNPMVIDQLYDPYGVNFSPDGRFLYVSHLLTKKLRQYDLGTYDVGSIKSSIVSLSDGEVLGNINYAYDGELYVAQMSKYTLARINDPDLKGTSCDFELNAISTGTNKCIYGLPQFFIYSNFEIKASLKGDCLEDSVELFSNLRDGLDSIGWLHKQGTSFVRIGSTDSFKFKFNDTGWIEVAITNLYDTIYLKLKLRRCKIKYGLLSVLDSCIEGDIKVGLGIIPINGNRFDWYLDRGNGLEFLDTGKILTIKNFNAGLYKFRIVTNDGVHDTTLRFYKCDSNCLFIVPNVMTPNGDSINDDFRYDYPCVFESFEMEIYNRWGEKLFETDKQFVYWNGTYHGEMCPDGVYLWLIKFKERGKPELSINGLLHILR